ncbi:MAG: bifunctional folylpolyglutamate synthase/dihydrofolate synthase, partial [Burkholderiales bacterium]
MLSQEVIQHLIDPGNTQVKPGLDRMKQALALLANPNQQAKVIHITGTNGKGSTAAFIETGLIHAGYTVAKYTSPYIQQINETIRINGLPISDAELEENFFKIKAKIKQHDITLSPFEYLTVIMFYHIAKHQPDFLILEVGMGGENDATNVVEPLFSIITNISLEHTNWLGETLRDIAKEKAGIIKQGKVIIADHTPELIDEVKLRTANYLNVLDEYSIEPVLDAVNFRTMVEINHQTYAL